MSRHEEHVYIGHMIDAAQAVLGWTQGRDWASFAADDLLRSAVTYQIQIIGEAATHLSPEFRAAHPSIPWSTIIAMRNIIVHAYRRVGRQELWDVISDDLSPLIAYLEPLLPPEDE